MKTNQLRKTSDPCPLPSLEVLKERFEYDPESGFLIARKAMQRRPKGSRAGCETKNGYRVVSVQTKTYKESRIAYYMATGEDPGDRLVDHIDGDPTNNAIRNLRLVDYAKNGLNRRANRISNTGFKNVLWMKAQQRFRVLLRKPEGGYLTRRFKFLEDAVEFATQARNLHQGDYARHQ